VGIIFECRPAGSSNTGELLQTLRGHTTGECVIAPDILVRTASLLLACCHPTRFDPWSRDRLLVI
jgi:hypothetical protein